MKVEPASNGATQVKMSPVVAKGRNRHIVNASLESILSLNFVRVIVPEPCYEGSLKRFFLGEKRS